MQLLFIRHGEPDYTDVTDRHFIGHGRDLAKLSPLGVSQAEAVARDPQLTGASVILASPYTRALQTAAILSRHTGIPIEVETDLMEWMPDLTFQFHGPAQLDAIQAEMQAHRGEWDPTCRYRWESLSALYRRAQGALGRHLHRKKVIVVAHEMLIRQFVPLDHVPHCRGIPLDYVPPRPNGSQ